MCRSSLRKSTTFLFPVIEDFQLMITNVRIRCTLTSGFFLFLFHNQLSYGIIYLDRINDRVFELRMVFLQICYEIWFLRIHVFVKANSPLALVNQLFVQETC